MRLPRAGNPDRGRKVLDHVEKMYVERCRAGDHRERIEPELLGIGDQSFRVTIIESILEPTRSIAPSFDSVVGALKGRRVLNGVRMAQTRTETKRIVADPDRRKHAIPMAEIDAIGGQPLNKSPDGLE